MKLPFRQGLVDYQVDGFGLPQYLVASATPNYVDLNVSPTPCSVAFAHGGSDYLQVFAADVPNAWGPLAPATTSYLYWDIDLLTSNISYGFTTLEPVVAPTAPSTPQAPIGTAVLHWFDTSTATMKIWTGSVWRNVVRAFAGRVNGTTSNITFEPKGQSWRNALPVEGRPGFISTDIFGQPLRTVGGEFVTTSTPVRFRNTVGTSGVLAVLPNAYVPVRASENIPAMSLVYFSGDGTVGLASGNPAIIPARIPVGVVQDELSINEVGAITQSGEITYDQWDWSAHIGQPLYCGESGQIVTTRPVGLLAYRVGFVKSPRTILFQVDAETMPQVYQAQNNDILINGTAPLTSSFAVNGLGERVWTISLPAAAPGNAGHMTAAQAAQLVTLDSRLTTAEADILGRALLVHAHTIADVTGLQAALDGKAPLVHNHNTMYAPLAHNHDGYHALVVHSHTIPDVAGLQTALNGKADVSHLHELAHVNGLVPVLDNKINTVPTAASGNFAMFDGEQLADSGVSASTFAFASHTHSISHVTGLQVALDGKAALVHSHAIADVTGLQAALNGKADVSHVHSMDSLTDADTTTIPPVVGDVLTWNGTNWAPAEAASTYVPSLPSSTVSLGISSTFTFRPTQASMAFFSAYVADYPTVVQVGGTFNTTQVPTNGSFNDSLNATVNVETNVAFITTVDVGPAGSPPVVAEFVVNTMPAPGVRFFVGYWDQGFSTPFSPNGLYGDGMPTYFDSDDVASEVVGYGGLGSVSALQPWQPGDVIGIVRYAGGLAFYRNGVLVSSGVGVVDSNNSFFFCGSASLV